MENLGVRLEQLQHQRVRTNPDAAALALLARMIALVLEYAITC